MDVEIGLANLCFVREVLQKWLLCFSIDRFCKEIGLSFLSSSYRLQLECGGGRANVSVECSIPENIVVRELIRTLNEYASSHGFIVYTPNVHNFT